MAQLRPLFSLSPPVRQCSQGQTWGEYTFKLTRVFTVMMQCLASRCPETSVLCHVGTFTGLLTTWKLASCRTRALRGKRWRGLAGMKPWSFCNLIWKAPSLRFYHSLFLKNSKEQDYTRAGILERGAHWDPSQKLPNTMPQTLRLRVMRLNPFTLQMRKIRLRFRGSHDSLMTGTE